MNGLEFGDVVSRQHAPLVQRAGAIADAYGHGGAVQLRDASDRSPLPPRAHVVTLRRGNENAVIRDGASRLALSYKDPASETSLAALLACVTKPGMPIAA